MKLESVVLESSNGRYKYYHNYTAMLESDIKTLKSWLNTSVIPFSGFKGSVVFLKSTSFPRYKFTEYTRTKNQLVKRVRDSKNADAVVIDTKQYTKLLENFEKSVEVYQKISESYNNTTVPVYILSTPNTPFAIEACLLNRYYRNEINKIEQLIDIHDNFNSVKILDIFDINEHIGKQYPPIDRTQAEDLQKLLSSSDQNSVKLGMEIMTNCDVEASLLYIMLLLNENYTKIRYNQYTNSTNWKSFKNTLSDAGINIDNYLYTGAVFDTVQSFLRLPDKMLFEEDIDYIKDLISEEINKNNSFEKTGFKLINFNVELNIDPDKIIKIAPEEVPQEQEINDLSLN